MSERSPEKVTRLLAQWNNGDASALDELLPIVYGELRRLAAGYLKRENPGHTLQPTALVHEAYLRLVDQEQVSWQNRAHFFGAAANLMRQILIQHARAKKAEKREGDRHKVYLDEIVNLAEGRNIDLVALDDALNDLASVSPQQSRIVELRYFSGLTIEETAEVLGISPVTVKREWTMVKAWLSREIGRS